MTTTKAEAFDQALTSGTSADPAVAELVALTAALAAVPLKPAPAFKETLRAHLMAEAASIAAAGPVAPAPPAPRPPLKTMLHHPAMQVATGGLAAVVAATGVVVGTSRSLPGDALYGLKRTVEGWQVGLAGGPAAEANALLEQARTRLDEVQALLKRGDLAAVDRALAALQDELRSATSRLLRAAADGSREAYDALQAAVVDISGRLTALLPSLPAEARTEASGALATLNVARVTLSTLPRPVSPTPVPTTPNPTVTTPPGPGPTVTPPTVTTPPTGGPSVTVPPPPTVTVTVPPPPTITVPPVTPTLPVTLPPV